MFTPPVIGILTGTSETVTLTLADASLLPEAAAVTVELILSDDVAMAVTTLTSLVFDASSPSHVVELSALSDATLYARALPDHGLPNVVIVDGELPVNAVFVRDFEWVFRSATSDEELLEVIALTGRTTEFVISLRAAGGARLAEGEEVEALLTAPSGMMVLPQPLVVSGNNPTPVVSLFANAGAMPGNLQLNLERIEFLSNLLGTVQGTASLPVRVLRGFVLSFATPDSEPLDTARVLAGGATEVWVVLNNPGELLENEEVRVSLSGNIVTTDKLELTLTAPKSSTTVTIEAAYDAMPLLGTVEASGEVFLGGAPTASARVRPASLAAEVVARRFRIGLDVAGDSYTLGFSPGRAIPDGRSGSGDPIALVRSTITVAQTSTIKSLWVAVSITHPYANELQIDLISPDGGMFRLLDRMVGGENLRRVYTSRLDPLSSLVDRNAQGEWVLTVGDYSVGATGTLDVWGIGFGTREVRVAAGASTVVTARLVPVDTGLGSPMLFSGEEVAVGEFGSLGGVEYFGEGVTMEPFSFTAENTDVGVTLTASADATSGALLAQTSIPVNAVLDPSFVVLEVRVELREFWLSFDRRFSRAQVLTGRTTRVAVVLNNSALLLAGEEVRVMLSAGTVAVDVPELTLTASAPNATFVISAAADVAPLSGMVDVSGEVRSGGVVVANTRVFPASLRVEILPREFALLFETPEGRPFPMAQVLAGGFTEVTLRLENSALLLASEEVRVMLSAGTVAVDVPELTLTASTPGAMFTVGATFDVAPLSGMVDVSGEVRSGGVVVENTDVRGASLPVGISQRVFRLLPLNEVGSVVTRLRVPAGRSAQVVVSLSGLETQPGLGVPSLAAGETLTVGFVYEGELGVSLSPVLGMFSSENTRIEVALSATSLAQQEGSLMTVIIVGGLANASVGSFMLPVEVLPRETAGFALSFAAPGGGLISMARVPAGSATEVAVVLDNPALLLTG